MDTGDIVLGVVALGLAAGLVWALVTRGRVAAQAMAAREGERRAVEAAGEARREGEAWRERADASTQRVVALSTELAGLREQLAAAGRTLEERDGLERRFSEAFEVMTARALKASRAEFLEQARPVFEAAKKEQSDLVKPIGETLAKTAERLVQLDERVQQAGALNERLRGETERLTRALSRPEIRGRYGEVQLRRVAELAGMRAYCDFDEQATGQDEGGNAVRPDLVVRLPNERVVAVDAKTNINAYIEAVNARDEPEREAHLERFARHVAEQAKKLSDKRYWTGWSGSPEFVVMFVPGDHFIDAALSRRPDLLEFAAEHRVILASPSTLIGLLRAVHVGWREHTIAAEARELFALGKELHERAGTAFGHIARLGAAIKQSAERYNDVVGSIDSRLVPTLKKFEDAGAKSAGALAELKPVEAEPRALRAGEGG